MALEGAWKWPMHFEWSMQRLSESKNTFLLRSVTMFFSIKSSACWHWLSNLSPLSLLFSPIFLFPPQKLYLHLLCCLYFNFNFFYILLFLIIILHPFVEVLFIFNFIIPSQFTNIIFFNLVLILLISIFFP